MCAYYGGQTYSEALKRQEQMRGFRSDGWSLQKIGDHYGVTREAVRQILKREYGSLIDAIRSGNEEEEKTAYVEAYLLQPKIKNFVIAYAKQGMNFSKASKYLGVKNLNYLSKQIYKTTGYDMKSFEDVTALIAFYHRKQCEKTSEKGMAV